MATVNTTRAAAVKAALMRQGLTGVKLQHTMTQGAHESDGYNSKVFISDNNPTGIKYIGKPLTQINAKRGTLSPEGNHYAHFASLDDWARDYIRILSKAKSNPLAATDTADFAKRLKAAGYYTDTVENYVNGLKAWGKKMGTIVSPMIDNGTLLTLFAVVAIVFYYSHF